MYKKFVMVILSFISIFVIVGCANEDDSTSPNDEITQNENTETDHSGTDHSGMDHSSSGEVPEGLKEAENPTYPVGSKAIIKEAHMEGMEGAEATIVGAYDTVAYAISYNPTTGGERVTNHKWVIHEEIPEAGEEPLEPGTEVTVDAAHMEGMEGATAEIDFAEKTTVYMIDFTTTTEGEEVTNHKWVTESELSRSSD
ncbi:YdhK family protein [Bacillus sp. PS06]|uniref:YdhK family protein n=1 Tax=Bacillus sp. PS06 TaxID=2764176 RepID=UPI00177FD876|nr:YdhK family protein [Bacillus sp. PS06]MBD8071294.1 YdhK family protein [Bacillus sp. PS06]